MRHRERAMDQSGGHQHREGFDVISCGSFGSVWKAETSRFLWKDHQPIFLSHHFSSAEGAIPPDGLYYLY